MSFSYKYAAWNNIAFWSFNCLMVAAMQIHTYERLMLSILSTVSEVGILVSRNFYEHTKLLMS